MPSLSAKKFAIDRPRTIRIYLAEPLQASAQTAGSDRDHDAIGSMTGSTIISPHRSRQTVAMSANGTFPKVFIEQWSAEYNLEPASAFRRRHLGGSDSLFGERIREDLFNTDQFITDLIFDQNLKKIYPYVVTDRSEADFIYADVLLGTLSIVSSTKAYFEKANAFLAHVARQAETYLIAVNRPFWYFVNRPFGNLRFPPNCIVLTIEKCLPDYRTVAIPYPTNIHFKPDKISFEPSKAVRTKLATYAGRIRPNVRGEIQQQFLTDTSGRLEFYDIGAAKGRVDALDSEIMLELYESKSRAVFAVEPPGDTPSRKSIYDSLMAGAIPVLSAETRYELPFPDEIAWDRAAVFVPELAVRKNIGSFLALMDKDDIEDRLRYVASINRHLQYCDTDRFCDWDAFACAMKAAFKAKTATHWAWSAENRAFLESDSIRFNTVSWVSALAAAGEYAKADAASSALREEILRTHRGIVALLEVAEGLSRPSEAANLLKIGLEAYPDSPPLLAKLVTQAAERGRSPELSQSIDLLLARCHDFLPMIPLAELLEAKRLLAEAGRIARHVRSAHPSHARICMVLSRIAASNGNIAGAQALAETARAALGETAEYQAYVDELRRKQNDPTRQSVEVKTATEATRMDLPNETISHFGVEIEIDTSIMSEHMIAVLRRGGYETVEANNIAHIVKDGDVVLELGSGIGFVATLLGKSPKTKRVVSYEANPKLIPAIEKTLRTNLGESSSKCEVRNAVLANYPKSDTVDFYLEADFWASSLVRSRTHVEVLQVPVHDFNSVLRELRPTFIVCDIEGGEAELLRDADLSSVERLFLEVHFHRYGKEGMRSIFDSLHSRGFVYDQFRSTKSVVLFSK